MYRGTRERGCVYSAHSRVLLPEIQMADSDAHNEVSPELLKKLGEIERAYEKAEVSLLSHQEKLFKPLNAQRGEILEEIPQFWSTVFEHHADFGETFLDVDDAILLNSLKLFDVSRPHEDPRDLEFTFEFEKNEYLQDDCLKLVKAFKSTEGDGTTSLTSTVVPIRWKKDKDLTKRTNDKASFFNWFAWEHAGSKVLPFGEEAAEMLASEIFPDALKIWSEAVLQDNDGHTDDSDVGSQDIQSEDENDKQELPKKKKQKL